MLICQLFPIKEFKKPSNPLCIEGQSSATREVKWIVAVNAEIPAAFSDGL